MNKFVAALGTGLAVGLVIATFEAVKNKQGVAGSTWGGAIKSGLTDTSTLAGAAAGVVAGFFLVR